MVVSITVIKLSACGTLRYTDALGPTSVLDHDRAAADALLITLTGSRISSAC